MVDNVVTAIHNTLVDSGIYPSDPSIPINGDVWNERHPLVTLSPPSSGDAIIHNGTDFICRPLASDDIVEGANLYFTNERVDDRVAAFVQNGTGFSWTYDDSGNTLTGNVSLSAFTTSNLTEGSNLYFTGERVDDRVASLLQPGTGISFAYDDTANTLTPTITLSPFSTSDLAEGSNLYYTNSRADARITAQKGAASGLATLGSDSKIPTSQLPALAITTVSVVGSQAAQLALTAEEGDVAIRTDLNKSYVHNSGSAGTMADWSELLTPTDTVLSVNGFTGAVTLTTSNMTEGTNLYFTDARVNNRKLSVFNATTSAELAGVISDETGSGPLVFGTSPTIVTPTIAKLANLTTNGFVKTSGGNGTLSVDTTTYATSPLSALLDCGGFDLTDAAGLTMKHGTTYLRVGTTAADNISLQAYNTGSGIYKSFAILTSGATPTCDLDPSVTIGGNQILSGTLTANTLVLGGGAGSSPTSLGAGTSTQVLHGNASGAPTWSAVSLTADVTGTLGSTNGGTAQNTYALGDTLHASATNTLSKLAGNTTTTRNFLRQTGNGTISAAPAWDTVTASDVGLGITSQAHFGFLGVGVAPDTGYACLLQAPDSAGGVLRLLSNPLGVARWHAKLQNTNQVDLGWTESGVADNRLVLKAGGGVCITGTTLDANYHFQLPNSASQKAKANAWDTYSDLRLKEDLAQINDALSKVCALNGYRYTWRRAAVSPPKAIDEDGNEVDYTPEQIAQIDKDETTVNVGGIAQEWVNHVPEIVTLDKEGVATAINYGGLAPYLVEAIKALYVKITDIETSLGMA